MDMDWFEDDATKRFTEFIKTAWPKEHLDENLTFVADNLNPKTNELPEDTMDLDDGVKVNYGKFGNLLAEKKTLPGDHRVNVFSKHDNMNGMGYD